MSRLLTLLCLLLPLTVAADETIPNPLIPQRADPFITRHTDGYYYFMGTVPEYDRLELRRAPTLAGLAGAAPKVIWRKHATGEMGAHIWAPEIHFINGKWYIYFAFRPQYRYRACKSPVRLFWASSFLTIPNDTLKRFATSSRVPSSASYAATILSLRSNEIGFFIPPA